MTDQEQTLQDYIDNGEAPLPPSSNPVVTGPSKSIVNKPNDYNGSEAKYDSWKRQVRIYVLANKASFASDLDRVLVALSFMKTGKANRFAQAAFDNIIEEPAEWLGDWKSFWEQMDAAFLPADAKADAARDLNAWKQDQLSADEYFIEFDMLATRAGYSASAFDPFKIRLAMENLNRGLVRNLHLQDVPSDWESFKTAAARMDRNYRAGLRVLQQSTRSRQQTRPTATSTYPTSTTTTPSTYQGQGRTQASTRDPDAMDVDTLRVNATIVNPNRVEGDRATLQLQGACFYCRERGHMKSQCPKLTAKNTRTQQRGAYVPPSRPTSNITVRSQATGFDSPAASIAPSESISRVVSPTPQYSPPRSTTGTLGFVNGQ